MPNSGLGLRRSMSHVRGERIMSDGRKPGLPLHASWAIDPQSFLTFFSEQPREVQPGDGDGDKLDREQKAADDAGGSARTDLGRFQHEVKAEKLRRSTGRGFPRWKQYGENQRRDHDIKHRHIHRFRFVPFWRCSAGCRRRRRSRFDGGPPASRAESVLIRKGLAAGAAGFHRFHIGVGWCNPTEKPR